MNVAVIGASDKEDRYSNKAVKLLKAKGHQVYPVHKRIKEIDGQKVYASINDVKDNIDTITLYVAADISSELSGELLGKDPKRIIFNPGAENPQLAEDAKNRGIKALNACTLVLLNTGQF